VNPNRERQGAQRSSRRVTIQDVADSAGVSVSAVSKVIRGANGVSPAMRATVNATIAKLGYRPHAGARAMRGRSFTIGVALNDILSPFQTEVAQAISDEVAKTSYQVVITAAGTDANSAKRCIEALVDRQVDGLVLVAPWIDAPWIEGLAAQIATVAVALHGSARHLDTVINDERRGACAIVDHLVDLGHTRVAHTSMHRGASSKPFALSHTMRRAGYVEAMEDRGLQPDVVSTSLSELGGYQAAMTLLRRNRNRPTAIFAGADTAALGVMRAAGELRLRIPDDLSVVGYDNVYLAGFDRISLTTVDQSASLTGSESARLLLERINGRVQPVQYLIAPSLVVRSTTAAPAELLLGR